MSEEAVAPGVSHKTVNAERVDRVAALLKQHQDLVYKQETIAKFFSKDSNTLSVAKSCWEQIHDQVGGVIQEKYHRVLEELKVAEKLSQLEILESTHQAGDSAWRPSGSPEKDFNQAAGAVIRTTAIPEFEKMYEEVQGVTNKLQDLMKEKQQELAALEAQITNKLDQLNTETVDLT